MLRHALILLALTVGLVLPAAAQQDRAPEAAPTVPGTPETLQAQGGPGPGGGLVRSPILTINPDRLFSESLYGKRVTEDLNEASEALAAENRRIEAELTAKERSLTERRPDMDPEDFRAEAEAFDERVQRIRREQDAKENDLQDIVQEGQSKFREAVRPILGQLMLERGAAVLLDRRSVVLGVGAIDITDEAIARVDTELGDGAGQGEGTTADSAEGGTAEGDTPQDGGLALPTDLGEEVPQSTETPDAPGPLLDPQEVDPAQ